MNDTRALSSLRVSKNYAPQHKSGAANAAKASEIKRQPVNEDHRAAVSGQAVSLSSIPENAYVMIVLDKYNIALLPMVKSVMTANRGDVKIILYDSETKKKFAASRDIWIKNDLDVLRQIRTVIGYENVKIMNNDVY